MDPIMRLALALPIVLSAVLLGTLPANATTITRGDQADFERQVFLGNLIDKFASSDHDEIRESLAKVTDQPERAPEVMAELINSLLPSADWPTELEHLDNVFSHADSNHSLINEDFSNYGIHRSRLSLAIKLLDEKQQSGDIDAQFALGFLALSQLSMALPFRDLPKHHELREDSFKVSHKLYQPVDDFLLGRSIETLAASYQEASQSWEVHQNQLRIAGLKDEIDEVGFGIQALASAADKNILMLDLMPEDAVPSIKDAAKMIELAAQYVSENQLKEASVVYSSALRRVFPQSLLYKRNELELRFLLKARNTLQFSKHFAGDDWRIQEGLEIYRRLAGAKSSATFNSVTMSFSRWFETSYTGPEVFNVVPYVNPKAAASKVASLLNSLVEAMPKVEQHFKKEQTYIQSWQYNYNQDVLDHIDRVSKLAKRTAHTLQTTKNLPMILGFYSNSHIILSLYGHFSESVMMRYSSHDEYYRAMDDAFALMTHNKPIFSGNYGPTLRKLFDEDTSEYLFWNVYFTRQNAVTAAVAVVLIVEAITFQWEAVPATLALTGTVGKAVIATNSALNLLDRQHKQGWYGLLNFQSAIDVMMMISLLPRITPVINQGNNWQQATGQFIRNRAAIFQHSVGRSLVWLVGGVGIYEYLRADAIAKDLQEKGYQVSSHEIRRRGLRNALTALMLNFINSTSQRSGINKYGEPAQNGFSKLNITESGIYHRLRSLNPWGGFGYFRNQLATRWTSSPIAGKVDAAWFAITVPALNYILINEAILYSHTTLDFSYNWHTEAAKPYPNLKEGESAVLAIGFEENDLLYVGAHSDHFQRRERELYKDRFHVIEFSSPKDLFWKLEQHAQEHGPIRYLKIAAHGIPGMISTRNSFSSPTYPDPSKGYFDHLGEPGYISINYLKENLARHKRVMSETMAADARVLLVSCLVGSNYDKFDFGDDVGVAEQGDLFLDVFSETFLPHGGRLDASRRILMGIDMIFGAMFASQHQDAIMEAYPHARINQDKGGVVPLSLFKQQDQGNGPKYAPIEPEFGSAIEKEFKELNLLPSQWGTLDGQENQDGYEQFMFSANRIRGMLLNIHNVWWRYGVMLEGEMWSERYNYRVVNP